MSKHKNKPTNMATHLYNSFINIGRRTADPEGERQLLMQTILHRKLDELAMSRFKWVNMPHSVDIRFMERTLHRNALSVFYFEPKFDKFLALPATQWGQLDYNDNPVGFRVRGGTMIHRGMNAQQCVPIWANGSRIPDTDITVLYSQRLAGIDRTLEINTQSARQPRLLVADEHSQLSVENFNRELDRGVPVIRVRQGSALDVTPPTVLDMGVNHELFDKLSIHRNRVWSECMTLLGISNANQDKKERLVESEVAANDEQIDMMKAVALDERMVAADRINRKYGLNVEVRYDTDATEELASTVENFLDNMNDMTRTELDEADALGKVK